MWTVCLCVDMCSCLPECTLLCIPEYIRDWHQLPLSSSVSFTFGVIASWGQGASWCSHLRPNLYGQRPLQVRTNTHPKPKQPFLFVRKTENIMSLNINVEKGWILSDWNNQSLTCPKKKILPVTCSAFKQCKNTLSYLKCCQYFFIMYQFSWN